MLWLIYSFLYATSVGFMLVFTKLVGKNFSFLKMNIGIGIISLIILFLLNIKNLDKFRSLTIYSFITALLFTFFNYSMFRAVISYHNPGVINALLRLQIMLTFLASLFIFKTNFDWKKMILICLILLGALITVINFKIKDNAKKNDDNDIKIKSLVYKIKDQKDKLSYSELNNLLKTEIDRLGISKSQCLNYIVNLDKSKNNQLNFNKYIWLVYTILAIIFYSSFDISTKLIPKTTHGGIHTLFVMIIYTLFFIILLVSKFIIQKIKIGYFHEEPVNVEKKYKTISKLRKYTYLILLGLFFTGFIVFINKALHLAPSPAVVKSIGSFGILVSLILTYFMFKELPSRQKMVGIAIILASSLTIGFI